MRMEATRGRSKQTVSFLVQDSYGDRIWRTLRAGTTKLCHPRARSHPEAKVTWSSAPGGRGQRSRLLCMLCAENFMVIPWEPEGT